MKRIDVIIKTTKLIDDNNAFRICTEETGDDAV
jgi:hypothetical protein